MKSIYVLAVLGILVVTFIVVAAVGQAQRTADSTKSTSSPAENAFLGLLTTAQHAQLDKDRAKYQANPAQALWDVAQRIGKQPNAPPPAQQPPTTEIAVVPLDG